MWKYKLVREREPYRAPVLPARSAAAARIISAAAAAGARSLDEYASKQLLSCYGIPVSPERLARTEEEALEQARLLGYPVAVKACAPEIIHKTGKGLLYLNVTHDQALRRSFRAVREAAETDCAVLVSKMIAGEREFVAGMTRYPGFGPCVMFGLGGIYTEALRDAVFRAAPLSRAEALEMLKEIRAAAMLDDFRGMPAADRDALAAIIEAVGAIPLLHPEVAEIDLNPVIISGTRPVVVDALIILA